MIINSIYIENFRGFKTGKPFSFNQKSFILLSASNGKGKTTIIDAIEWCLTGKIGRLSNSYNTRSTNDTERKKNVAGILKNKNCDKDAKVKVVLNIIYKEETYTIERTQKKDKLNVNASKILVNGSEEKAQEFLNDFVDKNFYNYYFCDVQKTFNLLSKKRSELSDVFEEFISDYSREENIIQNLSVFKDDVDRRIEEFTLKRVSKDVIQNYESILVKYSKEPSLIAYNNTAMYSEELLDSTKMSIEKMSDQLDMLYKCGYNEVSSILKKISTDEKNKANKVLLSSMLEIMTNNRDKIEEAIKLEFQNNYSKIDDVFNECEKLKQLRLNQENIHLHLKVIYELGNSKFTEEYYSKVKKSINETIKQIEILNDEINILTDGNEIIDTLATIINKKKGLLEYRNDLKKKNALIDCPICGSSEFSEMDDDNILKTAEEYMGKYNQLIVSKKAELESMKKNKQLSYDRMLKTANSVIAETIGILEQRIVNLNTLKIETFDFFTNFNKLNKENSLKYSLENLTEEEFIADEIQVLLNNFYSEEQINLFRKDYNILLDLLGYKKSSDEHEKGTYTRVVSLSNGCPEILEFSTALLTEKINSLKSYISNSEYLSAQELLGTSLSNNKRIEDEIKILLSLKTKAQDKANEILDLVSKLKKKEYENVGPFLHKFYKKLSRVQSVKEISLLNEENKISLSDEKSKSLMNVLSNGQLSVFMLAYFLGGAISRTENTKFKVYFIDDLTACMDDINMLAFIDFLKYLLKEENRFMEQIFFVTCDDRIRRLIEYKLKGGGIQFEEIGESAFA
jgi:exonuclease SbcC